MNLTLNGFDSKNNPINLPKILWYEHLVERYGFEEIFTIGFSDKVDFNLCKVLIIKENNKECECFVDSIEIKENQNGVFCEVKLKNIICRLFENQIQPKIHKVFSLEKMLKKYTKQYNISCLIPAAYKIEIKNFYIDLGMTPLDVINLFFQTTFKKDIFLTEGKKLCFTYRPSTPLFFGQYKTANDSPVKIIKYNTLKMLDDRSKLISDAFVKIVYEDNDSDFLNLSKENTFAKNCNIERVKYCNVPLWWQILPKNGSDYMVKKENKKRFRYEITTFEDVDVFPGMVVKVKEIANYKDLIVFKVLKTKSENKQETKIFLINSNI